MAVSSNSPDRPEHPTLSSGWLAGVQQMDPQSWSRLVNTFAPIVYLWCRTAGVSKADSPDVVQNVFASVARGVGAFERKKEQGSFRSWLATITRNQIRDYFRKQSRRVAAAGGTDAYQTLQQQPDDLDSTICPEGVEGAIHRRLLESVRAEFEPATWEAFWLTTVEERSAAEVSEVVGISVASVYQSKSRVLRRLRQLMREIPE